MSDIRMLNELQARDDMMKSEASYQQSVRPSKEQLYRLQAMPIVLELVKTGTIAFGGDDGKAMPSIKNFIEAVDKLVQYLMKT